MTEFEAVLLDALEDIASKLGRIAYAIEKIDHESNSTALRDIANNIEGADNYLVIDQIQQHLSSIDRSLVDMVK